MELPARIRDSSLNRRSSFLVGRMLGSDTPCKYQNVAGPNRAFSAEHQTVAYVGVNAHVNLLDSM